uniref:Uncharacterized protein n=1 Tax=Amphiprion ocellaris TaxID=80972 RepID=A0AAQ5ZGD2_AMPOC
MGGFISQMFSRFSSRTPVRILMVGLDAAGKTTLLYRLKLAEVVTTIPTIGFNVETVDYKNISFTVWDVGGQTIIRPLWRHYYVNTQGLIFVVDSSDSERIKEAADELHQMTIMTPVLMSFGLFPVQLEEDELRGVALLVFANKQDMPRAMSVSDITEALSLSGVSQPWSVQSSCAISGSGLVEGLDWLSNQILKQ